MFLHIPLIRSLFQLFWLSFLVFTNSASGIAEGASAAASLSSFTGLNYKPSQRLSLSSRLIWVKPLEYPSLNHETAMARQDSLPIYFVNLQSVTPDHPGIHTGTSNYHVPAHHPGKRQQDEAQSSFLTVRGLA
jgi:hypothetical protein